jgi:FAD-dependent urate hydroxylase
MHGSHRPIVVAGAGVGGLTVAAALLRRGFTVTLLERSDEIRASGGSGLTIWGNAMTALGTMGIDGDLRERGAMLERQLTVTASGATLLDLPVGQIQRRTGRVGVGIRRRDLLETLLAAADGAEILYGEEVSGVRKEGELVATMQSGREIACETLIGADGLRSSVREALLGDGPPSPLRHIVWRGVSEDTVAFPGETSLMVYGPRGVRMVGWPVGEGRVCWSIACNGAPARERREPSRVKRELQQAIAYFPQACRDVLAATPVARIIHTDLFARSQVDCLTRGPIALLGDAGHAMPTVFGQGAAMAIEDAVVLADCLGRNRRHLPTGLEEYEQIRLPRLLTVRGHVSRVSRLQEWRSPVSLAARNAFLRLLPKSVSERMWTELMTFALQSGSAHVDAR